MRKGLLTLLRKSRFKVKENLFLEEKGRPTGQMIRKRNLQ